MNVRLGALRTRLSRPRSYSAIYVSAENADHPRSLPDNHPGSDLALVDECPLQTTIRGRRVARFSWDWLHSWHGLWASRSRPRHSVAAHAGFGRERSRPLPFARQRIAPPHRNAASASSTTSDGCWSSTCRIQVFVFFDPIYFASAIAEDAMGCRIGRVATAQSRARRLHGVCL